MFYGKNLQLVRMLHGLSRKELGERLDVTEQSIWQFEKQMTEPSLENVFQLKSILQVKSAFFFEQPTITQTFPENNVAYRKADVVSRKKTNSEVVYLNVVAEIISYLEGFLNVPSTTLIALRKKVIALLPSELTNVTIDKVATLAREFLNIQPDNSNLLLALEKSGIHILEKNVGGKADAYSAWSTKDVPIIVLGIKKSAVRRNFDLAHELGHLLLHAHVDFSTLEKRERAQIEKEADYFASCFLLPVQTVKREFEGIKKISNPDSYIPLKLKYHVSIQALEMRAYKLGFLTAKQHSYFYRQISLNNYKMEEPLDREIVLKRPGKIRSIFRLILSNHVTDLQSIEEHFQIERSLLEEMFSIESDFFIPYEKQNNFTDFNNILRPNFNA
ncbi:spr1629 family repressor/antitoxin [Tetragenococcus koreensis]|uniref:Transcriptional regulator n=1 Tax=Tetragenococcus koreensis TaxID=290335 RepID=A0AAN4ZTG5_9ENTE|nr:XRE family transcriptional regulator [Tetragenococcus koreensis]GEQ50121.1 transcriptional regulator [Tetragenococcus koreensis]GEQ52628.1 transcriptional regulator [Tetragenococcus koreensis]GEQ55163.1 transcriptional regulator [Tetragenococcus koreensis]GEQ57629.1 transcriptional regulator [Tetragenococcus koreensis]GEQ60135.1 transcriptional regulator [Tetragenococcus koreensis]